jgi:hypothetical protein
MRSLTTFFFVVGLACTACGKSSSPAAPTPATIPTPAPTPDTIAEPSASASDTVETPEPEAVPDTEAEPDFTRDPDSAIVGLHPDGRAAFVWPTDGKDGDEAVVLGRILTAEGTSQIEFAGAETPELRRDAWVKARHDEGFVALPTLLSTHANQLKNGLGYAAKLGGSWKGWYVAAKNTGGRIHVSLIPPDRSASLDLGTFGDPACVGNDCVASIIRDVAASPDGQALVVLASFSDDWAPEKFTFHGAVLPLTDAIKAKRAEPLPSPLPPLFPDTAPQAGEPVGPARAAWCDMLLEAANCNRDMCQCSFQHHTKGVADDDAIRAAVVIDVAQGFENGSPVHVSWLLIELASGWRSVGMPIAIEEPGQHAQRAYGHRVQKLELVPARGASPTHLLATLENYNFLEPGDGESHDIRWICTAVPAQCSSFTVGRVEKTLDEEGKVTTSTQTMSFAMADDGKVAIGKAKLSGPASDTKLELAPGTYALDELATAAGVTTLLLDLELPAPDDE